MSKKFYKYDPFSFFFALYSNDLHFFFNQHFTNKNFKHICTEYILKDK